MSAPCPDLGSPTDCVQSRTSPAGKSLYFAGGTGHRSHVRSISTYTSRSYSVALRGHRWRFQGVRAAVAIGLWRTPPPRGVTDAARVTRKHAPADGAGSRSVYEARGAR